MSLYKLSLSGLLLLLLASCATTLENSRDALRSGDRQEAKTYLLKYCDEHTPREMLYPEPGSGVSFFVVLERFGSAVLLQEVYRRKFPEPGPSFLRGGLFSSRVIKLAEKWNDQEFLNSLAARIEREASGYDAGSYNRSAEILPLARFASLRLSRRSQGFPNLTAYWEQYDYSKNVKRTTELWDDAKYKKASSFLKVLSRSIVDRALANKDSVIELAAPAEMALIFKAFSQVDQKDDQSRLLAGMKRAVEAGRKVEKNADGKLQELQADLNKAQKERDDISGRKNKMQAEGRYTFKEEVRCNHCRGRAELSCGTCQGRGHCGHCDHGHIDCHSCHGHGHISCNHCHGSLYIYVSVKVLDKCGTRYVTRSRRVRCSTCIGGHISCHCHRGRVTCGYCRGHWTCRTCRGHRFVDCPSCVGGTVVHIRRTKEAIAIDEELGVANGVLGRLRSKIENWQWIIRKERRRREVLQKFLQRPN